MRWSNQEVLVTGGASFIGSHLVEDLVDRGANVRIIDDFSSGTFGNLDRVEDEIEILVGDLQKRKTAMEATEGIEAVFHLAADHGGRGYIANNPASCATNMALDNVVYQSAVENGVDRITYASSACVYPTDIQQQKQRLSEDMVDFEERGGAYADDVYGWAKLMGELSLKAHHEEYGVDASMVRIFSAYGPRENETHAVMALMAKAYAQQDPFEVWGDGEQTRNFTYVKDITRALRLAAENITDGTAVNAGTDRYVSINEIVEILFDRFGWEPEEIDYMTDKPVGVRHRSADTTRAEELLGWEPQYTLRDGIKNTLQWYVESREEGHVEQNLGSLLHDR